MIEVIVQKKANGKLSYFVANADIIDIVRSYDSAYMADANKLEKSYKIHEIQPSGSIIYDYQSIDIFCSSNGKKYRSIPKQGQRLLLFKNLDEYNNYLKTYKNEMANQKNNFDDFAKTLMNAVNDLSTCFSDEKHSALDLLEELLDGKKECKCNCKKTETNNASEHKPCSCSTSCSFSMSINNDGVHVYRTNDKFYINDTEVSKEDYNSAVNVLSCTGDMQTKINSIKDILDDSVQNSAKNSRIAELEARILEAQKEIESLRRK